MSTATEKKSSHSVSEFQNLWTCQKLIKSWVSHPEWNSYDVIPSLYTSLHVGDSNHNGIAKKVSFSEVMRTTNAYIQGAPENLLPEPNRAYLLFASYSDELDLILRNKPKKMDKAIEDAAFAYYVFERIHPFPDGNGRVGRMIAKAVLKSGNLKDPIFHDQRWFGGGRSEHLQAIEKVSETNNLSHLELYIANSLIGAYSPYGREFLKSRELLRIIEDKQVESRVNNRSKLLRDIWSGFGDLPLYGNSIFDRANIGK